MDWQEAKIVINGHECTHAEAMTIRVALESFANDLVLSGLGCDPVGLAIKDGYMSAISAIRQKQRFPKEL